MAQSPHKFKHILVSLNGDPTDRDAVDLACRVAKPVKAHIYAVYVIQVRRSLPLDADIPPEIERGDEILRTAEEWAAESGVEMETELLQAREAGPALVDEAIARNIDLILVGLNYKVRLGEFDPGSAASHLLRKAPCRVWILRGPIPT